MRVLELIGGILLIGTMLLCFVPICIYEVFNALFAKWKLTKEGE